MQNSPSLGLAYLQPQQAQKHVTVNSGFRRLDALVQTRARSAALGAEPAAPAEGDLYILPAGAAGASWDAFAGGALAVFQDGAWSEIPPQKGWRAYIEDEDRFLYFNGADWRAFGGGGTGETATQFGVNTTADATNRLAVKSDAILFNHDDVTPGSGDMRAKVNKATTGDTGSHLFQTNASGRAEFGLIGNDDFTLKVSPDGSTWKNALIVDKDDAHVGIGGGAPFAMLSVLGDNVSDPQVGDIHIRKEGYFAIGFLDAFTASGNPFFGLRRARGTIASPAAVQNGDTMGAFSFRGYSPAGAFVQTAVVAAVVDTAPSGSSVPMAIYFATGTTLAVERMRLTSGGDLGLGMTTPACKLDVDGPVRVKSYVKTGLPSAASAGQIIYVSNEVGGAVLAFSDGTNWRRVTDRAVVA